MNRAAQLTVALTCLLAPVPALAGSYLAYVPAPIALGGTTSEVYVPQVFDAHDGLTGPALVDAAMAELGRALGNDLKSIKVALKGTAANLTLDDARRSDPAVADRALGAAFHTLRTAGITDVRLNDRPLSGASFTRGALLPIIPITSAMPPRRLSHGYVLLGAEAVTATEFNRRVAASDPSIRAAVASALESGTSEVKLAVLEGMRGLTLKDRSGLLVPRLSDPDPLVRLQVLDLLADNRDPAVLTALEKVAGEDAEPKAKSRAARILVAAGRGDFKKYLLLEKLQATDAATIIAAANELVATGDPNLAPAVGSLVAHSSPEVRAVGVKALIAFKQHDAMVKRLEDPALAKDAAQPIAQHLSTATTGAAQAAGLSWLVASGDAAAATGAAAAIGKGRVPGTVAALGKALGRSEPGVRAEAAKALGALRDAQGLEALALAVRGTSDDGERKLYTDQAIAIIAAQPLEQVIKISESPDETVRELAVKSLAEFARDRPNPRVLSVLRSRLSDTSKPIRQAAVYALARINDPGVVQELAALKGDPDPIVREQVAHALTASKHPEADAILLGYLDDPDNRVKQQAVIGVRTRKTEGALEKLKWLVEYRHTEIRREVMRGLVALSQPGDLALFETYQQRLYDEDPEIRILAITSLSQYPTDPRTAPAIGGAVTDQDVNVKLKAIEALSQSKDQNAVEQVIRGLFDESNEVKLKALGALEVMASTKAIKALQEFILNESDEVIKKRATQVLDTL